MHACCQLSCTNPYREAGIVLYRNFKLPSMYNTAVTSCHTLMWVWLWDIAIKVVCYKIFTFGSCVSTTKSHQFS